MFSETYSFEEFHSKFHYAQINVSFTVEMWFPHPPLRLRSKKRSSSGGNQTNIGLMPT